MSEQKCKHPSCTCFVSNDKDYCSTICEDSADSTELTCQCHHPGCRGL
jgi:hypothetical protein